MHQVAVRQIFSPSVLQRMIIIIPPVFCIHSSSGFGTISCPLAATLQRDSVLSYTSSYKSI